MDMPPIKAFDFARFHGGAGSGNSETGEGMANPTGETEASLERCFYIRGVTVVRMVTNSSAAVG
jgi:hypothetical protein